MILKRMRVLLGLILSVLLSAQAAANDSGSELAAGGIVLVKNDDIAMQREDLTLSPSEVRVRYEMLNDSGKPVTLRVAFPMPELPAWSPGGYRTATSPRGIMLPQRELGEPNFMGFRVWADGRELTPEVEIRATLPDCRDIAAAVQESGGLALVLRSDSGPGKGSPRATSESSSTGSRWPLPVSETSVPAAASVKVPFHFTRTRP